MKNQTKTPNRRRSGLGDSGKRIVDAAVRKGPRNVLLISSALGALLFYAGYTYLLSPLSASNADKRESLAKLNQENETNRAIESTKPEFDAELRRGVLIYRDALTLLPNDPEGSNVLAFAQDRAQRAGVSLNAFNGLNAQGKEVVQSASADKLYEKEMPAVVVGNLPQIKRFFEDIARLPRIVHVKDIAMTSLGQRVMVSFTLIAYYAPKPSDVPPLPQQLQKLLDSTDDPSTTTHASFAAGPAQPAKNGLAVAQVNN